MSDRLALVQQYRKLVHKIAKKFFLPRQHDDLVQEGYCGLLEAYDRYEPSRGVRFTTFAYPWVFARMQAYCERTLLPVTSSHNAQVQMRAQQKQCVDQQHPISQVEFLDVLPENRAVEDDLNCKIDRHVVWDVIAALPEKEKYILLESVVNETTLSVIGSTLGISRQRVYQIYEETLALLRKRIKTHR